MRKLDEFKQEMKDRKEIKKILSEENRNFY